MLQRVSAAKGLFCCCRLAGLPSAYAIAKVQRPNVKRGGGGRGREGPRHKSYCYLCVGVPCGGAKLFPPTVKIKTDLKQAAAREHLELIHCCSALGTRGAWKLVAAIAFCVRHCRLHNHFVTVCAPPAALNEMAPKVAAGARKKVDRRDPYRKLSSEEVRLAQLWHAEDDMEP